MKQGSDWVVTTQDSIDLKRAIVQQVEWYFSDTNLFKDYFLLQKMDLFGAVPLSIIAFFPKMVQLTQDMDLIQQAIVEYANTVQLNEQQMTIRRVDSHNYISSHQCVKLRMMESRIWESIESNLIYCGLWNCLLFGCFDAAGNWNLVFPSQWHAKAAQHRILQMFPFMTKQLISICSFTHDGMFCWQPLKEKEQFQEYDYLLRYPDGYSCPILPVWYSSSIVGNIPVPVETQFSYSSYDNALQEAKSGEQTPLPISTCANRDQFHSKSKYAQQSSTVSVSSLIHVPNDYNQEKRDKKQKRISKDIRESRQRQPRQKGKNSQQQNGKQRIRRSFQIQAEDFPPLPGEKLGKRVVQLSTRNNLIKEQENIEEAVLAFGEMCVSNSENERDRNKSMEKLDKSYAHVAASFIPSVEENRNRDSYGNAKKERHQSSNSHKRRQRRRERKWETLRSPSSVPNSVPNSTKSKQVKKESSRHGTRNRRPKEVKEWTESPILSNNESIIMNKEKWKEAEYLFDCDKQIENDAETRAEHKHSALYFEEITKNEELNSVCAPQVTTLLHSRNVLEETPLATLEQQNSLSRLSPTAVDSTCCGNWQLASSQVSEPIAVVENVICDDEAKSILQVLEQLHSSMDSRTDLENSYNRSISKPLENLSKVEQEELDYFPATSVVTRNPSTVSSGFIEEGLKFFAKDIFS
ncbi:hypothetical protein Gasu2_68200 [Galdieria sulphuraria]|nr:hypothetical protein Gasu2_68200 [Galdieria sulphuraria]